MQPQFASSPAWIAAQPILERSEDGLFPQAERLRSEVCHSFERQLHALQIDGLVLESSPHVHPCWVKLECWLPAGQRLLSERVSALVEIELKPYHRSPLLLNLKWHNRGKEKQVSGLMRLGDAETGALLKHFFRGSPEPAFGNLQIRQLPWQFWRPTNRLDSFRTDWAAQVPALLTFLGAATISLGIGIVFLIGAFAYWLYLQQRTLTVRTSGKPMLEPRILSTVDAWQTIIFGAGADAEWMKQTFLHSTQRSPHPQFRASVERIWYWSLDSKEEREQIVLSFRRGLVFVQIHGYSGELYVGWDAHLNQGTWIEQPIATGIDKETGRLTQINTVVQGRLPVNEYDVSDLSCLTEWVHGQLVYIVKQYLAHRQIDQEIDFKIIRGERKGLVAAATEAPAKSGLGAIFKRNR